MSTNNMEYVRLGKSGLKISKIVLGCMSYGTTKWQPWVIGDEEESIKHVKTAYDAGINAFDTANMYSNGVSEMMLGKAIKKLNLPRDEIVVMTKVYFTINHDPYGGRISYPPQKDEGRYVNQYGLSRKHIFASVKASLERLQLDYIDLLQCHRFDPETPIEETMQALHDVVQAGYVRYIGMSSCHAYQFHIMQNYAIQNKLTPFISMQNQYSLLYREEEREMFPTLKHFGVGSIPWSPLARGILCRPFKERAGTIRGETDAFSKIMGLHEEALNKAIVDRVEELANKKGVKMAQIAIAWCLAKDGVNAPIVGTTSLQNLVECIDAVNIKLTPEEIKYLEEVYTPRPIAGHS